MLESFAINHGLQRLGSCSVSSRNNGKQQRKLSAMLPEENFRNHNPETPTYFTKGSLKIHSSFLQELMRFQRPWRFKRY